MKNRRNYYRVLHVQPDAPCQIIKASYRTLMQKLKQHPDLGGDSWNASILNEAYATLTNTKKRAAYDEQYLYRIRTTRTPPGREKHDREKHKPRKSSGTRQYREDSSACPFCGTPKPASYRYNPAGECSCCHSPLKPVPRLRLAGKARRILKRTLHRSPLVYVTHPDRTDKQAGITRDLSPHGMQFSGSSMLDENQVIKIDSKFLSAVARVSYCHRHKDSQEYIVGVEFITLTFHSRTGTFISESA